jgi:hypothetical protein
MGYGGPHSEVESDAFGPPESSPSIVCDGGVGQVLASTEEEKDFNVTITNKLKLTAQCARATKRVQTVLEQVSRTFHYRDRNVFVRLCPHLEFCRQTSSP